MKITYLCFLLVVSQLVFGQWSSDTLNNTVISEFSNGAVSKVAPTDNNQYYVSYYGSSLGGYYMNLQLLDFEGNKMWATNGITISDNAQASWVADYDMISDHDNNAIIAFADIRNGDPDIFIYKINDQGVAQWGENGICLSSSSNAEYAPRICVLSDNSVIACWAVADTMKVQKILPDGTLPWGVTGMNITESGKSYGYPTPIADADAGFLLPYFKQTGNFPSMVRTIYVNRFDGDGEPVWADDVEACGSTGITAWDQLYAVNDGNDGVLVYWKDDRDGDMNADVAVQKIDNMGVPAYIPNGVELSSDGYQCFYPVAKTLSDGSVIAFFTKTDASQGNRGMFVQKISPFGEKLFGANAKQLISISSTFNYTIDVQVVNDKLFCLYSVFPQSMATNEKMYIYALNTEGNDVWPEPLTISLGNYSKSHPYLSLEKENQLIVSWENGDNGYVIAQNFTVYGGTGVIPVAVDNHSTCENLFTIMNGEIHIQQQGISTIQIMDVSARTLILEKNPTGTIKIPSNFHGVLFVVAQQHNGEQQVSKVFLR